MANFEVKSGCHRSHMRDVASVKPQRYAALGAAALGLVGAVVGLIIGLYAHAPTAPFALVELGLPAAILGALLGLIVGWITLGGQRARRQ